MTPNTEKSFAKGGGGHAGCAIGSKDIASEERMFLPLDGRAREERKEGRCFRLSLLLSPDTSKYISYRCAFDQKFHGRCPRGLPTSKARQHCRYPSAYVQRWHEIPRADIDLESPSRSAIESKIERRKRNTPRNRFPSFVSRRGFHVGASPPAVSKSSPISGN